MERLGDDARRALAAAGMPEMGVLGEIVGAWPAAVGETIARNAWPQRLRRDGTLVVATRSSTWAFELTRLESEVRSSLHAALGDAAPAALAFAPGQVPEPAVASRESPERVDEHRIDAASRRRGAEIATAIGDPELRELVARAAAASLSRACSGRPF